MPTRYVTTAKALRSRTIFLIEGDWLHIIERHGRRSEISFRPGEWPDGRLVNLGDSLEEARVRIARLLGGTALPGPSEQPENPLTPEPS
jgi:hypothetical protein